MPNEKHEKRPAEAGWQRRAPSMARTVEAMRALGGRRAVAGGLRLAAASAAARR